MNNSKTSRLVSDTIIALRFPLIVSIVFIHTFVAGQSNIDGKVNVVNGQYPLYDFLDHIIRICLAEIAVPLFFVISGFLFFYQCDFNRETYIIKLKKRIWTLLIPYLIWNSLFLLYILVVQLLLPMSTSIDRKLVMDYTFVDILDSYWSFDGVTRGYGPICGPLWFLRDLIVANFLSPVVYLYIKNKRIAVLIILAVLYVWGFNLLTPGVSTTTFLFYSLGAWASVNRLDVENRIGGSVWLIMLCVALLIADVSLWMVGIPNEFVHRTFIISGIFAIISLIMWIVSRNGIGNKSRFLSGCSFFVYLSHVYVTPFLNKCWILVLSPVNEITASIALFMIPLITCIICIGTYSLLKCLLPQMTAILVGGRV